MTGTPRIANSERDDSERLQREAGFNGWLSGGRCFKQDKINPSVPSSPRNDMPKFFLCAEHFPRGSSTSIYRHQGQNLPVCKSLEKA